MSQKIMAYMRIGSLKKLSSKLRLPIDGSDMEFIRAKYYNMDFGVDFMCADTFCFNPGIVYSEYFDKFKENSSSYMRYEIFDFVRGLEQSEIWLMEEIITDYGEPEDCSVISLDKFISNIEDNLSKFEEFDINTLTYDNHGCFLNYRSLYHDTFTDLFAEVENIETAYHVEVLGLKRFDKKRLIRVARDGQVFMLNLDDGTLSNCTYI